MSVQNVLYLLLTFLLVTSGFADEPAHHEHHHSAEHAEPVERPKIFLDKSPRIVQYQLQRLDNQRLLLVERSTEDAKYEPVYNAILTRAGISPQYREESLKALQKIRQADAVTVLMAAIETLDYKDKQQRVTTSQLANLLFEQSKEVLQDQASQFTEATSSDNPLLNAVGYAGLILAGNAESSLEQARQSPKTLQSWLEGVALIPNAKDRGQLSSLVLDLVAADLPVPGKTLAINTLSLIPQDQDEIFQQVAPLFPRPQLRSAVVTALLSVPADQKDAQLSATLAEQLVEYAENTPAAKRTTDAFISAMQLADQVLARIPVELSRTYRKRLQEVTVRVVVIHTVEEEMRYDIPFFAVQAGKPVQIVLKNEDIMPHNLVITQPDGLQEVAQLGLQSGPEGGSSGKAYVPDSPLVMHATEMVPATQDVRLTFTAPDKPGEYPYVCTFPRHWMRMYGVMVVTEDLDAWLKDPVTPKDPVGSQRSFVQAWKPSDFSAADLKEGLRGRTAKIGEQIYKEATCAQCHKMHGEGGSVGPELTDVLKRWKGDRKAVLREILDPSHRIDDKYAMHTIVTFEGQIVSGIVVREDKKEIAILENPEAKSPRIIPQSDIDEMVKTSKSMMPKALLDRFTKDEIQELLALLMTEGDS